MDRRSVFAEATGTAIWHNDVFSYPFPEEFERMRGENARLIGTRYMRFPRWGTLVSHAHVAELGGIDAVTGSVNPAVVRPLSGGVYFQLTDSVATAGSDEAAAKQQAFTEVGAKLLPPPIAPRS
jgi:hypothetical protein